MVMPHPKTAARHRCLLDPAAFIAHCLTDPRGQPLEMPEVHVELQRALSQHRHALVELPRDHGKSTQICGRVLWELGRNPSLRIKIICANDPIAAERSRFLRDAIENSDALHEIFPSLNATTPWSADAFTIVRPGDVIGPSVAAFGVGAGSTGTRADLLICDDAVDVRSIHSKVERDRVADYFTNNLMNLLEPDGRCWVLFTPWHLDDLNARLKRNELYALFHRAIGSDLQPVWLSKWPSIRLAARKNEIGSASFARGYRLVPVSEEETPIRPAWVRFWTEPAEYEEVILSVDPAVSGDARADRSALVVIGRIEPSELHVLAAAARRVPAPELVSLIDAFDRAWNPSVILFESNAAFQGMKDLLARHTQFGAKLKSVTQTKNKAARIAAFSVAVENGSFRLKGNAKGDAVDDSQRELFEEMINFPFGEHDDLADAAATGCAYLLDRTEPRIW